MYKVGSKQRIVALLIALVVLISSFANVITVWGDVSDLDATVFNHIKVINEDVIGKIEDDTAYVKHGNTIKLDCSDCSWENLAGIRVSNDSGENTNTIHKPGVLELPMVNDLYRLSLLLKDDSVHTVDLSYVTGFNNVFFDLETMETNSLSIGGKEITEGSWLVASEYTLNVIPNTDLGRLSDIKVVLNGNNLPIEVKEGCIEASSDEVKDALAESNFINLSWVNDYGSIFSKKVSFKYDSSKVGISGVTTSNTLSFSDDSIITIKGTEVNVEVNGGASGVSSLVIKRDDEVVSTEFPFIINDEGFYTVEITTNSGRVVTEKLFGDHIVRFDTSKPSMKEVRFCGEVVNFSDWYKSNGILDFIVKDNVALQDKAKVTVNDIECDVIYEALNTSGKTSPEYKYSINTNSVTQKTDGIYNIKLELKDLAGNDFSYDCILLIDTAKPSYEGVEVEITNTDGGIHYITDNIIVNGSFSDSASGVANVSYKLDENEDFSEISLPYIVPGKGTFKITDNAGNEQLYSLDELLTLLGIGSYVVDTDNPNISRGELKGGYSKDGKEYFSIVPTISYTITDSNMKSVDFIVNGVLQESTVNEDSSYNFTPEGVTDGVVKVEVIAKDVVGKSDNDVFTFVVDTEAPNGVTVEIAKPTNQKGDKVFYQSAVDLLVHASDATSGVSKYYMNDVESVDGKYKISEDGAYSVRVEDNLSNSSKTLTLCELLGWVSNSVVIDSDNPVIATSRPDGESSLKANWFDKDVIYNIALRDNLGINSAYVLINGVKVDSILFDGLSDKKATLQADTSKVTANPDGSYHIHIYVEDNSKRTAIWDDTIYIDTDAPTSESATATEPNRQKGNRVFFKKSFSVSISAEDSHSGVYSYFLNDVESLDGTFTIDTDGEYFVTVKDILGNISKPVSLGSLLHWEGNKVVIDESKPDIITERPEGDVVKSGWFNKDVVYSVKIQDDKGLNNCYAVINGVKVDTFETDDVAVKEVILEADTSKVAPNADGSYNVVIYAEDNSTNPNNWLDTIHIDGAEPTNISATAPTPVNEKDGFVYYNSPFDIQLSAEDDYAGVGKYYLNNESNQTGKFTISSNDEYTVWVSDSINNTSKKVSLASLLDWSGNNIIIDSDKPDIIAPRPDGVSANKPNWYNSDVIYNIKVSDDKGLDHVVVKINGVEVDRFSSSKGDVVTAELIADTSMVNPNSDGSYNIYVYAEDNAVLHDVWSDVIYIDKTRPAINDFLISGSVSSNGSSINGSDNKYGFFFDGKGSVQVSVKDDGISSGIYSIWTKLDGFDWKETLTNGDTVVTVDIPKDYKGSIQAYAVDNVGHKSGVNKPDGLVSESSNTHLNHSKVGISFDTTNNYDENNLPLYGKDVTAKVNVNCDWSGLKRLEWGIDNDTLGTITDFTGASKKDKNLALSFDTSMYLKGNSNALTFWVKVTDNAGHVSENSRQFSIDKDNPVVSVVYDTKTNSNYYQNGRTATITVDERNFDSSNFVITGDYGVLSGWSLNNNGQWVNTVSFNSDGDYQFTVKCSDRAGNPSNVVTSESFTVDKTNPTLSVSWSNSNPSNGRYYGRERTAVITVVERNFDSSLINVVGATVNGWSHSGDRHTASISFSRDGEYSFSINGKDLANNSILDSYSSGDFVIDTSAPSVSIKGITEGVSYKKDIDLSVVLSDAYLNLTNTTVRMYGKNHAEVDLSGMLSGNSAVYSYNSFPKDKEVDDVYTLVISAVDMAGNHSEKTLSFSVNRFGSDYSFLDAEYLGNYLSKPKTVQITETNVDKIDTSKVKVVITLNGKEITVNKSYFKIKEEEFGGKYLYTYIIDKAQFSEDGKYTIQIYSTADDGTEYTSVAEQYDFVVDTAKPNIIISGVSDNSKYQGYDRVVTIDVRDLSGVKEIQVTVNGEERKPEFKDGVYSLTIYESSDYQNLKVTVVDNAGNEATDGVDNFMITSNVWIYLWNQVWFKIVLGFFAMGIIALLVILLWRKNKDDKEEQKLVKENQKYYSGSGGSSVNSASSDETNTDIMDNVVDSDKTSFVNTNSDESDTNILE